MGGISRKLYLKFQDGSCRRSVYWKKHLIRTTEKRGGAFIEFYGSTSLLISLPVAYYC
jgi:hypothetical protein